MTDTNGDRFPDTVLTCDTKAASMTGFSDAFAFENMRLNREVNRLKNQCRTNERIIGKMKITLARLLKERASGQRHE